MTFFEHTESWFKGESFEGGMLSIFGAGVVILALYFWKFGHTPTSRVLVIPFLVVGLIWGVAGLMVDHTSEHNARAYSMEINKALES